MTHDAGTKRVSGIGMTLAFSNVNTSMLRLAAQNQFPLLSEKALPHAFKTPPKLVT